MSEITDVIAQQRAALAKREAATLKRLTDAYLPIKADLEQTITELTDELQALYDAGEEPSLSLLARLKRSRSLLDQTNQQLTNFATDTLGPAITTETSGIVGIAEQHAFDLIETSMGSPPEGVTISFDRLPTSAINNITATTSEGPLTRVLARYGDDAAVTMRQELITGLATGRHPYVIAQSLTEQLEIGFSKATTIARTETMRAYREATREVYRSNSHIVTKYIWHARLSERTCAACWALHGTEFDTNTPMGNHPNCRCTPIPKTKTWAELGFKVPANLETSYQSTLGPDEFAQADEDVQLKVLGPAAYADYKAGEITLPSLIKTTNSPVWGQTYSRDSLENARRKTANQAA